MTDISNAKKTLSPVKEKEHYFVLLSGQEIKSLAELEDALHHMTPSVFSDHVTPDRNDFANWVRYILKDESLAKKLESTKDLRKTYEIAKRERDRLRNIIIEDYKQMHKQIKKHSKAEEKRKKKEHKEVMKHNSKKPSHPPAHTHMRGPHEHIRHRIAEFVFGAIFGAVLMLIFMRMLALV